MDIIESLCDHLPGPAAKPCKDEVEKMLPVAITFITTVAVRCMLLGSSSINGVFCSFYSQHISSRLFLCRNQLRSAKSLGSAAPATSKRRCSSILSRRPLRLLAQVKMSVEYNFLKRMLLLYVESPSLISLLPLLLCLSIRCSPQHNAPSAFFLSRLWRTCCLKKGLRWVKEHTCTQINTISLRPAHPHRDIHGSRRRNASRQHCRLCGWPFSPFLLQGAVIKLLEEICHILPHSYRDQCEAVVGKFSKTVLDAILGYATPQAICALIHLCKGQEAPLVGKSASPSVMCAGPNSNPLHTFGHIL